MDEAGFRQHLKKPGRKDHVFEGAPALPKEVSSTIAIARKLPEVVQD